MPNRIDHPLDVVQVPSGGECTPDPGKNDDVRQRIDGQLVKKAGELVMRDPIDRIEALRPIERGSQEPAFALELKRRVA